MRSWISITLNLLLAVAFMSPKIGSAQVVAACPDHIGGYGPYDYTNPDDRAKHLAIVETYHFTPPVEALVRGTSGTVGDDLDYTIRAFPNHHRALDAMSKLSIKLKAARPRGSRCSVDGYFERAIRFQPNDGRLHMIYGLHLHRWNKIKEARQQFEQAGKLAPDDVDVNYNLGLVYADFKEWDKASDFAEKAYSRGFPLPGLKNKLKKVGKWKEPKSAANTVEDVKSRESTPGATKSTEVPAGEVKQ
jgi:tetratricopeptide (TPR) repeat protein